MSQIPALGSLKLQICGTWAGKAWKTECLPAAGHSVLLLPPVSALQHQGAGGAGHARFSLSGKDSRGGGHRSQPGTGDCFPGMGLGAGQNGHKMLGSTPEISEEHEEGGIGFKFQVALKNWILLSYCKFFIHLYGFGSERKLQHRRDIIKCN